LKSKNTIFNNDNYLYRKSLFSNIVRTCEDTAYIYKLMDYCIIRYSI
jgi:hypothetical protein